MKLILFSLFCTFIVFSTCLPTQLNVRLFINNEKMNLLEGLNINWDHYKRSTERDCYITEEQLKVISNLGIENTKYFQIILNYIMNTRLLQHHVLNEI